MESNASNHREKGGAMIILSENNYEAWSSICLDHLLAYPGPWDWIKSGVEPEFEVPPLEIPGPELRRGMPAARRAEPRGGGRGAVRGRNLAFMIAGVRLSPPTRVGDSSQAPRHVRMLPELRRSNRILAFLVTRLAWSPRSLEVSPGDVCPVVGLPPVAG